MKYKIKQYDIVEITKINCIRDFTLGGPNSRKPEISDVATVVEIYESPCLGYELECVESSGETNWLHSFPDKDVELKILGNLKNKDI
jgi:hypothetical protein